MKRFKSLLCIILSTIIVFSIAGCKDETTGSDYVFPPYDYENPYKFDGKPLDPSKTIDADLSDWTQAEKEVGVYIEETTAPVSGARRSLTIYARYVADDGLYLGFIATHQTHPQLDASKPNDWWIGTNFEFTLNTSRAQRWSNSQNPSTTSTTIGRGSGGMLSAMVTEGEAGNFISTFEGFVAEKHIPYLREKKDYVRLGVAFKAPGEQAVFPGRVADDWWYENGHRPDQNGQMYYVNEAGVKATKDIVMGDATMKIDGDLSDWSAQIKQNRIDVYGTGEFAQQGFTTYAKYIVGDGIYIAGTAKHKTNPKGNGDWWLNTNFEFFINGNNQHWLNNSPSSSGNMLYSFAVEGEEGDYNTTWELYIDETDIPSLRNADYQNLGVAFKPAGEQIVISGRGADDWWYENRFEPRVAGYYVYADGIHRDRKIAPNDPTKTIDGDLSDWIASEKLNKISLRGDGEASSQGMDVYSKFIEGDGLYIGGTVLHKTNADVQVRMFLNDATLTNSKFVNTSTKSDEILAVAKKSGSYTTTFEVYIDTRDIVDQYGTYTRLGISAYVQGEQIVIDGGTASDNWFAPAHRPNDINALYYVDANGIYESDPTKTFNSLIYATSAFLEEGQPFTVNAVVYNNASSIANSTLVMALFDATNTQVGNIVTQSVSVAAGSRSTITKAFPTLPANLDGYELRAYVSSAATATTFEPGSSMVYTYKKLQLMFSFGSNRGVVSAGYSEITDAGYILSSSEDLYKNSGNYGWTSYIGAATACERERTLSAGQTWGYLERTFIFNSQTRIFRVDLPNGEYTVSIMQHDSDVTVTNHDQMQLRVNGVLASPEGGLTTNREGDPIITTVNVTVINGVVEIELRDLGGADSNWVLNALTITPSI